MMTPVPATLVRTSHAITIKANGETVGLINGWNPTQGRTVTPIFEVMEDDSGNPKEYMPGNMSGMTINVSRFDTFVKRMEEAFGTRDLTMLTRQSEPFDVIEVWRFPTASSVRLEEQELAEYASTQKISTSDQRILSQISKLNSSEERFIYTGCWFSSLGRTLRSDDTRIVNVNAALVYTKKLRGGGIAGGLLAWEGLPI